MENYVKELTFGSKAFDGLMEGVNKLGSAVSSTLGAGGSSVIIEDGNGEAVITKDGVSVANSVVLKDSIENIGAKLVKNAASKTVSEAGDGTTTSTILAWGLLKELAAGKKMTPRDMKDTNLEALEIVNKYIDKNKKAVVNRQGEYNEKLLKNVATISANNDKELGNTIASAFIAAGTDGTVMMGVNDEPVVDIETTNGSAFELGLKNPHFATNGARDKAELEKGAVLLVGSKVPNIKRLQNILEYCIKQNMPILIVADVENEVMGTLAMNKERNGLKINLVDAPMQGINRKEDLDDLAAMTGATVVNENIGDVLESIGPEVLGYFDKAVTDANETVFTLDNTKSKAKEAADALKVRMEEAPHQMLKNKLKARIGRLLGKVSVVKVGADTPVELSELKDRVEDAICATTAAVKDGIVSGGGVTLKDASKVVEEKLGDKAAPFCKALLWPYKKIAANAGFVLPVDQPKGWGLNAITGESVKTLNKGIIDPALVTKSALKNAVSVVNTMISTNCIINNIRI